MSTSWPCTLVSTPTEKVVLPHQQGGTISSIAQELVWISSAHTRQPIHIPIKDIEKRQEKKDVAKIRFVLRGGSAYVFELPTTAMKDALVAASLLGMGGAAAPIVAGISATSTPNKTTPSASTGVICSSTTDIATSGSSDAGNLDEVMAKGSSAFRRGAAVGGTINKASVPSQQQQQHQSQIQQQQQQQSWHSNTPEAIALRAELLKKDPELRGKYQELVHIGKIVTAAEFWNAPRNRAALLDLSLRKPKVGLANALVDELAPLREMGDKIHITIDTAFKQAVFGRERKIKEAFAQFVPITLEEKVFWNMYLRAILSKRQKASEEENILNASNVALLASSMNRPGSGSGGGGSSGGSSSSAGGGAMKIDAVSTSKDQDNTVSSTARMSHRGIGVAKDVDISSFTVDQFFDLYVRGAFDQDKETNAGTASASSTLGSSKLKRNLLRGNTGTTSSSSSTTTISANGMNNTTTTTIDTLFDPTADLLATVEEGSRQRRTEDVRAGYGISRAADQDDADNLQGFTLAEFDSFRRKRKDAEDVIESLNQHSSRVVEASVSVSSSLGSSAAAAAAASSSSIAALGGVGDTSSRRKGAAVVVGTEHGSMHQINSATSITSNMAPTAPSSSCDDLPDLYRLPSPLAGLAPLKADFKKLRLALRAQGQHEDSAPVLSTNEAAMIAAAAAGGITTSSTTDSTTSSLSVKVVGGGWDTVEDAAEDEKGQHMMVVDGIGSSGKGGGGGGWGDAIDADTSEAATLVTNTTATAPVKNAAHPRTLPAAVGIPSVVLATSLTSKQTQIATRITSTNAFQQLSEIDQTELLRTCSKASRSVTLDVIQRSHNLFSAHDRSLAGFADCVPQSWQTYVLHRFRLNNDIMLHLWNILSQTTANPSAAAIERARKLWTELQRQHDDVETLKQRVTKEGANAIAPPVWVGGSNKATSGTTTSAPSSIDMIQDDDAKAVAEGTAKSEVVKLLLLLQSYMEPTLIAGRTFLKDRL